MDHGVTAHTPSEHDKATENHCRYMFRSAECHSLWCMYAYMHFQQYDEYMYNHNQSLQVPLTRLKVFLSFRNWTIRRDYPWTALPLDPIMQLFEWHHRKGDNGVLLTAMKLNAPAAPSNVMQTAFVIDRDDWVRSCSVVTKQLCQQHSIKVCKIINQFAMLEFAHAFCSISSVALSLWMYTFSLLMKYLGRDKQSRA